MSTYLKAVKFVSEIKLKMTHNPAFERDSPRSGRAPQLYVGHICVHSLKLVSTMSIPKVFISYSHDSTEHKKWVLDLATSLRSSGVDAVIDQWDLRPGDDLAHFMETQLTAADRVLMVCTDKYVEKANAGIGGVGYEKMIVTAGALARII